MRFIDRAKRVLLGTSQKTRIVSLVSFCFAFIAFGAAAVAPGNPPDTSEVAFRIIEEEIQLPPLERQLEKIRQEKQVRINSQQESLSVWMSDEAH